MDEHPIQSLMKTAMESIKEMVDVNTIVGDAVETNDGTVIIPISRVTFGFAAGGGDYEYEEGGEKGIHPFGGGSGAGVSVKPAGFLVCSPTNGIRFMPVEGSLLYDRLLDTVPQVLGKIQEIMKNRGGQDDADALAETAETQGEHH
ncbi:MAG: GerW family sporulation protein [Negativicutes bacterium]|nr:GerW family sporulation protein [Negativicutes bacterium]